MRVLITALPAFGHLYPVMPIAEALRARGHRVVLATGARAAHRLQRQGWEVRELGVSTEEAAQQVVRGGLDFRRLAPPERWRFAVAMFAGVLATAVAAELAPVLGALAPELVLYEEMAAGAALAAARAGLPAVRHGIGPRMPAPMQEGFTAELERSWRAGGGGAAPEDLAGRLHLDVWPESVPQPPTPLPLRTAALRPAAWSEPGLELPALLAVDQRPRPVVYLTLGTVSTREAGTLRTVLEGLRALDVDVLASVGTDLDPAELGPAHPRVHLAGFVPADRVFGRVDAVVHHGGSGTFLGSLAAGVPQLVLPQRAHDQFLNARAAQEGGLGLALAPQEVSADAVRDAVADLLGAPGYRESSRLAAGRVAAMPAPDEVAARLEALAARG